MKNVVCYNPSQYTSFTAASLDGATSETRSTIDSMGVKGGVLDLIEIQDMVNERIGSRVVEFGVIQGEVYLPLHKFIKLEEGCPEVLQYIEEIRAAYSKGKLDGVNEVLSASYGKGAPTEHHNVYEVPEHEVRD